MSDHGLEERAKVLGHLTPPTHGNRELLDERAEMLDRHVLHVVERRLDELLPQLLYAECTHMYVRLAT